MLHSDIILLPSVQKQIQYDESSRTADYCKAIEFSVFDLNAKLKGRCYTLHVHYLHISRNIITIDQSLN